MDIIKKDLRQEALRLKAVQAQQPQGPLAINLTSEDSRRRKRERLPRTMECMFLQPETH